MNLHTLAIILVVLLVVGALPLWPYSRATDARQGYGWYPSGGLILLVVLLMFVL